MHTPIWHKSFLFSTLRRQLKTILFSRFRPWHNVTVSGAIYNYSYLLTYLPNICWSFYCLLTYHNRQHLLCPFQDFMAPSDNNRQMIKLADFPGKLEVLLLNLSSIKWANFIGGVSYKNQPIFYSLIKSADFIVPLSSALQVCFNTVTLNVVPFNVSNSHIQWNGYGICTVRLCLKQHSNFSHMSWKGKWPLWVLTGKDSEMPHYLQLCLILKCHRL